jgi:hypothetical protein
VEIKQETAALLSELLAFYTRISSGYEDIQRKKEKNRIC